MKSNARALLGTLVLCSLPVFAATASSGDEVGLKLGGAKMDDATHYAAATGSVVSVHVDADPYDLVWVFAVAVDQWGEPNYSAILTLALEETKKGDMVLFFEIPKALEGMTFQIIALAQDAKGDIDGSKEVNIKIVAPELDPLGLPNDSL
jgi:hypothetical protein